LICENEYNKGRCIREKAHRLLEKGVVIFSVSLVLFQLYTSGFGVLPDIVQRSVHLSSF
jgi:TRAP-type uncharacterized transport system fused permease subunit